LSPREKVDIGGGSGSKDGSDPDDFGSGRKTDSVDGSSSLDNPDDKTGDDPEGKDGDDPEGDGKDKDKEKYGQRTASITNFSEKMAAARAKQGVS